MTFERKKKQMLTVVKLGVSEDARKPREVRKAWLPASYQVITKDLAEGLGLKNVTGMRLTQVYRDSTAAKAGLKVGDLITHLDGERIQASQPEDSELLAQLLREYKVGSKAEMTILRPPEFKKVKVEVQLVATPVPAGRMESYTDDNFEFKARDVTYMDRIRHGWKDGRKGAIVVSVEPGGWARLAHLANGDLIEKVNGKPIDSVGHLKAAMKSIVEKKERHINFFVERGVHTLFVEMEPDWSGK